MITNTREGEEFSADKLDNINNDNNGGSSSIITIKPADSTTTSSSAWLRSKDPRIVRVSRAFGGKDRHSKVCTIRGLRDRRVRLSVPTAIQLYDLQDRLGLNQPSKVVDWLLNVAKDDIDELPPLQIPPGFNFIDQAHQAMLSSHAANQQLGSTSQGDHQQEPAGSKINATTSWEEDAAPSIGLHKSSFWTNSQSTSTCKFKHVVAGAKEVVMNEKEMWTKAGMHEDDHHKLQTLELSHGGMHQQVGSSSNNYFPRSSNNHSASLPNFLHSTTVSPYAAASYYHFDYPSNFSLSSASISSQAEDQHHNMSYNVVPLQSTTSLSLPSGVPHVLVCPPSQSYSFPSHVSASSTAAPMELDPRQFIINHFQILSPSQQQNSLHMSLEDDVNKKR